MSTRSLRTLRATTRSMAAGSALLAAATTMAGEGTNLTLTILHHNDGESQLVNLGGDLADFGGVARFGTLMNQLRAEATANGSTWVTLSSGDNFLAGPEFNASLDHGVPYYDSIAMDLIGYDAVCIGNHEFDFGPQTLASFITGFTATQAPFLSANLDFTNEPALSGLFDDERIRPRTIITKDGEQIGIVGATTPALPTISSPGGVVVDPDVVARIQEQVDLLLAEGVNKIILISHLQSVGEDLAIIPQLSGIDIFIAGGGDELLANPGDLLIPDDQIDKDNDGTPDAVFGPYPIEATDADGRTVYVVTGKGAYRYIGRLIVEFDAAGDIVSVDEISGPVRVAGGDEPDAVMPDPTIQAQVTDPVAAAIESLATNVIGETEVPLDGRRPEVRSRETNQGNLCADSLLWQATELAEQFDVPVPQVAFQNGGGIRNDSIIPVGDLTELDTFDIFPFANFVSVLPDVPATELLAVIENAVSHVDPPKGFPSDGTGRFAQVSGLSFIYDVNRLPGERVRSVTLSDGTPIIRNGAPVANAPAVTVATIDFLANGGDEYPFESAFTNVGVTYQLALQNYIEGGLGGLVTDADYPEGGEGRINRIDTDLNGDDAIDVNDLLAVLGAWGPCPARSDCPADLNVDGAVDVLDLLEILQAF